MDCVEKKSERLPFQIISDGPPELSFSNQPTNGIAYVTIVFDTSGLPQNLLPYISLFSPIVLQIGTRKKDFVELIQDIDINTGGITSNYTSSAIKESSGKVNSFLSFTSKSLRSKIPKLFEILTEIFTELNFDDPKRISELINIIKSNLRSRIIPNGHAFALTRLASYHSRIGQYREITGGISQYQFLESVVQSYQEIPEKTIEILKRIGKTLFNRNCMKIHLTGSNGELKLLQKEVPRFIDNLPEQAGPIVDYAFNLPLTNEAFTVPSNVQYVGKGTNLFDLGYQYKGNYEVLDTIINRDYLWNTVRVQGGGLRLFYKLGYIIWKLWLCIVPRS